MGLVQSNWRSTDGNGGLILQPPGGAGGMSPMQEQPARYESIQDLLGVLRRHWKTVAIVALSIFLLVLLGCLLIKSKYDAVATIEINRDATGGGGADGSAGGAGNFSAQVDDVVTEVATDTNILQGPTLAMEVIKKLDLIKQPYFSKVIPEEEKGLPLDRAPKTRERLIKRFEKSLKVESVTGTRLITVTYRNPDPVVAANVANTISETFISDYLQRKISSTSEVSYWISKQLDALKSQVQKSEQALADFEHKTGLAGIDMPDAGGGNGLAMQAHNTVLDRLNSLNGELTTAEANRISAETVYKLVQTQDPEVVVGLGGMSVASGGTVLAQGGGLELLSNLRQQEVPAVAVAYLDDVAGRAQAGYVGGEDEFHGVISLPSYRAVEVYGSSATSRAFFTAVATSRWCWVQLPVTRRARILPRSEMNLRSRFVSL